MGGNLTGGDWVKKGRGRGSEPDAAANKRRLSAATPIIESLSQVLDRLRPNEKGFVEELAEKIEQYEERTFVSQKQLEWLEALEERYL